MTIPSVGPAMDAYLLRVGAKQKNFRRYTIEERDAEGYPRTVAEIRIVEEALEVSKEEYAPTEEEQTLIDAELKLAVPNFPKSINARAGVLPPQLSGADPSHYFVFKTRSGDEVSFIQWRMEGEKPDLPLSFWSDGEWRMMEPDGGLPLYGLDKIGNSLSVMLHEGAKAAARVSEMIGDPACDHPLVGNLREYAHLGWPGGVHGWDRVDWSPIKQMSPDARVVISLDNDVGGTDVISPISAKLRRPLLAIQYTDQFPRNFDLADAWPDIKDFWKGSPNKRYVGPTLDELMIPATWATESVKVPGSDKPVMRVRDDFVREWLWCDIPEAFLHRRFPWRMFDKSSFNSYIRPFSGVDDTARLLTKSLVSRTDGVAYRPGEAPGVIIVDGQRQVNTWRPSNIKPVKGDPRPFVDYMSYLFNERMDRKKVYRWMTTLVCRPDIRMHYSLLLVSEQQGVGKTTLFESILAPLVGLWNCSFPTEADITDSSFNGWVSHKRLAVVNEIYGNRKRKTYDKIKSLITDANIEVNRKYQEAYKVTNYIHLGANSNSIHAIHIDDEDRRLMPPRVTDRIRDPAYWKQFYQWLHTGGLEIICWFLHELAKDHRMIVETGERAPYTSMKGEMIEASRSEGQQLAHEMAEYLMRKTDPSVMAINDVRAWIASKRGINVDSDKLEKPTTIIKAMRFAKVKVIKDVEGKPDRFMVDDRRSYLIANFDHEPTETQSWHTFKDKRRVPEEIWPMGVSH